MRGQEWQGHVSHLVQVTLAEVTAGHTYHLINTTISNSYPLFLVSNKFLEHDDLDVGLRLYQPFHRGREVKAKLKNYPSLIRLLSTD